MPQCSCHESAARTRYYTDNNTRRCLLQCNMPMGCSLSLMDDLLNNYAEEMVNYCTMASNSSFLEMLASEGTTVPIS